VDESLTMLGPIVPYRIPSDEPINKFCMTVDDAFFMELTSTFNVIFCQQGINYWFRPEHAKMIKRVLAPKGIFIFNTFNVKPSIIPLSKNYYYSNSRGIGYGRNYMEISWMVKDMVKHVQIAEGMDPHFTEFRWIPPGEFKKAFKSTGFKVEVKTDKATDIYICRKG